MQFQIPAAIKYARATIGPALALARGPWALGPEGRRTRHTSIDGVAARPVLPLCLEGGFSTAQAGRGKSDNDPTLIIDQARRLAQRPVPTALSSVRRIRHGATLPPTCHKTCLLEKSSTPAVAPQPSAVSSGREPRLLFPSSAFNVQHATCVYTPSSSSILCLSTCSTSILCVTASNMDSSMSALFLNNGILNGAKTRTPRKRGQTSNSLGCYVKQF